MESSTTAPLHINLYCITLQCKGFNFLNYKYIWSYTFWLANEEIKTFTDTKMMTIIEISLLDQDSCVPSDSRTHDHTVYSTYVLLYHKPFCFCTVCSSNSPTENIISLTNTKMHFIIFIIHLCCPNFYYTLMLSKLLKNTNEFQKLRCWMVPNFHIAVIKQKRRAYDQICNS